MSQKGYRLPTAVVFDDAALFVAVPKAQKPNLPSFWPVPSWFPRQSGRGRDPELWRTTWNTARMFVAVVVANGEWRVH
jgi:hypothetical protein